GQIRSALDVRSRSGLPPLSRPAYVITAGRRSARSGRRPPDKQVYAAAHCGLPGAPSSRRTTRGSRRAGFLCNVKETRQPMALGQLRYNRIHPLPFLEPIGAFLLMECSSVTKPRGAHAISNLCHCSRSVVTSQQSEAGGLDSLFVKAGRHKKEEEAAGGAK